MMHGHDPGKLQTPLISHGACNVTGSMDKLRYILYFIVVNDSQVGHKFGAKQYLVEKQMILAENDFEYVRQITDYL